MWDIMSIIAENNRYALQEMMGGIRLERARDEIPESWPLEEILKKLNIGPPLLKELVAGFTDIASLQVFLRIVREFLPDDEEEILSTPRNQRVSKFCQIFGVKYFPLPGGAETQSTIDFARAMPLALKGMSYTCWHDLEFRPGYTMLMSLVVYPYEGDERDLEGGGWGIWDDEEDEPPPPKDGTLMEIFGGARLPLIDAVQNIVGDAARRIPPDGWTAEELHLLTDDTKYDGTGDFAAWAMSETGCIILDGNYEDVEYAEGWGQPLFRWSKGNVDVLTKEWPKVKQIRLKIDSMVEWLEADPQARFQELLDFLIKEASKKLKKRKKRVSRVYDPTEHWVMLDQIIEEDDYAADELEGDQFDIAGL